ncbi:MAG: DNA topoisomerase IV [Desulfobulbaceae bacterium A2]|nr:MAG: DNA topoisomerase IV [Desulfobulbaceae bacterium A2]
MNAHQYDESKIKTLSSLEHIRKRPGMYIGRLGNGSHPDDGIYILLKEVVDNAVDEYIMGHGKRVEIGIDEEGRVRVRDFGRGIPLGKVVDCVSVINTGAKYNTEVFQFSVGLNGVGTKAVNALSQQFLVRSWRDGRCHEARFERGKLLADQELESQEPDGTLVEFLPDPEIFPDCHFERDYVESRLWRYAWLNAGLELRCDGMRYHSQRGLPDLLEHEVDGNQLYPPIVFRSATLEFACTHTEDYGEHYFSFVNGTFTSEGGTHLSAFREGLLKGINEFTGKKFDSADLRDGLIAALAVKVQEPIFESQTKNKLGNTEIRGWIVNAVREAVSTHLYREGETAQVLLAKVQQNESLRRELQTVRREAKNKARKLALRIPQLKDCKYHPSRTRPSRAGQENMLYITEGQSAAGSIVSSRDPMRQAVFSLKGKPLNVFGQRQEVLYKNEESYSLMRALGIEDSVEGLRYDRVIIATDADVDGLHIRNLLLTFFLHYFEEVVLRGHVHILETPIFRVRNREETRYCYTEKEKKTAQSELQSRAKGRQVEVTRFKGLGEISPKEFKQFIGEDMRLRPVTVDSLGEVGRILSFYMGKNTPERRNYIMERLV